MNINLNNDTITAIKKIANRINDLRNWTDKDLNGDYCDFRISTSVRLEQEVATLANTLGIGDPLRDFVLAREIKRLNNAIFEYRGIVASVAFSDIPADEWLIAKRQALAAKINRISTELGIA